MEQALKKRYTKQGKEPFLHEKFQMDIAVSQCAATGTINGDCCGWQDLGDGRTALVISDGMGKGKRAAAESLLVSVNKNGEDVAKAAEEAQASAEQAIADMQ